jgi:hypothetical protein
VLGTIVPFLFMTFIFGVPPLLLTMMVLERADASLHYAGERVRQRELQTGAAVGPAESACESGAAGARALGGVHQ